MSLRSMLELDARLSDQLRVAEKPGFLRSLSVLLAHSGDSWFWAALLIPAWFFSNSTWRTWEVIVFFGISGLAVVVMVIKFIVRRERPMGDWGSIYRNSDPHSFPSGHAARAFLIAMVTSTFAPVAWLVPVLWIWAPLVALARVAMGVHYMSDVVAGAVLGILIALLGFQFYLPLHNWFVGLTGFSFW